MIPLTLPGTTARPDMQPSTSAVPPDAPDGDSFADLMAPSGTTVQAVPSTEDPVVLLSEQDGTEQRGDATAKPQAVQDAEAPPLALAPVMGQLDVPQIGISADMAPVAKTGTGREIGLSKDPSVSVNAAQDRLVRRHDLMAQSGPAVLPTDTAPAGDGRKAPSLPVPQTNPDKARAPMTSAGGQPPVTAGGQGPGVAASAAPTTAAVWRLNGSLMPEAKPGMTQEPGQKRGDTLLRDADVQTVPRIKANVPTAAPQPAFGQAQAAPAIASKDMGKVPSSTEVESIATTVPVDRHVTATQANVVQTPAAPADTARHAAAQIAIAINAGPGKTTEIALNPAELGRVRLSLSAADTAIVLNVIAERPETQDLLRRHMDVLAQEFRQLGYTSISFTFGEQQGRAPADTQAVATLTEPDQNEETMSVTPPPRLSQAGLDIRI